MSATLIVDVFSGLPNPQWMISGDVLVQLQHLLAQLPQLPAGLPAEPPGLGYRGLILQMSPTADPAEGIRIWGGYVQDGAKTLLDPNRSLERWLLETGMRSAHASIVSEILKEIR